MGNVSDVDTYLQDDSPPTAKIEMIKKHHYNKSAKILVLLNVQTMYISNAGVIRVLKNLKSTMLSWEIWFLSWNFSTP